MSGKAQMTWNIHYLELVVCYLFELIYAGFKFTIVNVKNLNNIKVCSRPDKAKKIS